MIASSQADLEAAVLDSPACVPLLQAVGSTTVLPITEIQALKRDFGPQAFAAAISIVTARRKAAGKLPEADRLWLDPVRAEQATHRIVANHKARRFAGSHVADLCCGAGGDTFALARATQAVIAIDLDRDVLRRLARNLETLSLSGNVVPILGDASRPPVPESFFIHIDPDRRAADRSGRPTRQLEDYRPGISSLIELMTTCRGGAVKLGPAADFARVESLAARAGIPVETEIVSLSGECKEATVWFGRLAGQVPRRATMLPSGTTYAGQGASACVAVHNFATDSASAGKWLFELDPALVRSGLAGPFAAETGLKPVTQDGAWLTGHVALDSPWATRFGIVEVTPLDRKHVRAAARRLGWKAAVVKTRGGIGAEKFTGWFEANPAGDTRETLLIMKAEGGKSFAILALRPNGVPGL